MPFQKITLKIINKIFSLGEIDDYFIHVAS